MFSTLHERVILGGLLKSLGLTYLTWHLEEFTFLGKSTSIYSFWQSTGIDSFNWIADILRIRARIIFFAIFF